MQKTYHFSTDFQWQVIESLITGRRKPNWELRKIWEGICYLTKQAASGGCFPVFTHPGKQYIGILENGHWTA